MGHFEEDTAVASGPHGWSTVPTTDWNIGENSNGGYALSSALRAAGLAVDRPDPLSVTTHFLRPLKPDGSEASIEVEVIKPGRSTSVVRASLSHRGRMCLTTIAAFGDLSTAASAAPGAIDLEPPEIPRPDRCVERVQLEQGVGLPILQRLEVRIHPDRAIHAASEEAVVEGWIRFADGTPPSALALVMFADAFPPALFPRFGRVGWVPTVELTVHVRRRPEPGWILARLECDDLVDGRMIETGTLWDSSGAVVARSRQLGLLLTDE